MTTGTAPLSAVGRLRRDVARVPALGWDVLLAVGVLVMVLTSDAAADPDWRYYRDGANLLFGSDGLSVYANHPVYQIGPLSLGLAKLIVLLPGDGRLVAVTLTALLLVPTLGLVRRLVAAVRPDPVPTTLLVIGWVLISTAWFSVTAIAQFGDALALLGTLGAMLALLRGRPALAGTLFALGVAAKPWTLAALPLLLFAERPARVRALGAAALVGVLTWAPFVLSDASTLSAGKPTYVVPPDAWQRALGIGDIPPGWWRAVQLLVCWSVGVAVWLHARRTRDLAYGLVIAGALTALVRVLTDLGTWPYYLSAALPLVLVADLVSHRHRRVPVLTGLAWLPLLNIGAVAGGAAGATIRFVLLGGAVVVCGRRVGWGAGSTSRADSQ